MTDIMGRDMRYDDGVIDNRYSSIRLMSAEEWGDKEVSEATLSVEMYDSLIKQIEANSRYWDLVWAADVHRGAT